MNSPMNGQQQAYPPPLAQPDLNPQVTVTFDLSTWNLILQQLVEGPFKTVMPLIEALHKQIRPVVEEHGRQHQEISQASPGVTT